jgi:hypothetical protein
MRMVSSDAEQHASEEMKKESAKRGLKQSNRFYVYVSRNRSVKVRWIMSFALGRSPNPQNLSITLFITAVLEEDFRAKLANCHNSEQEKIRLDRDLQSYRFSPPTDDFLLAENRLRREISQMVRYDEINWNERCITNRVKKMEREHEINA